MTSLRSVGRIVLLSSLCLVCMLSFLLLGLRAQIAPVQAPPRSASATALISSSPSLTLPGSLTLTSTVAAPNGGGVPTGDVSFSYDSTNALGSAPLTILPNTQKFPAAPSTAFNFGTNPFAFWATSLFSANEVDLAVSDLSQTTGYESPVLTIFPGLGRGGFNSSAPKTLTTTLPSYYLIDAIASGNFKNDGKQEFLLHLVQSYTDGAAAGQLDVVDSTLTATPTATPQCPANGSPTCNPDDPDSERIVVDDFTGDGFDDVVSLVTSAPSQLQNYEAYQVFQPVIRIGVNNGNAATVGFTFGANAALPTFQDAISNKLTDYYCPVAIASGQFRTGGSKDVISVGQQSVYAQVNGDLTTSYCEAPASTGYLVLLLGDGKGGLTSQTPIPLGQNPSAVATADFDKDGNLDVIVADSIANNVTILFGNGDGTFKTNRFSITVGTAPAALRVADFNGDGYPDVAVSDGADGKIYVLLNNGVGSLSAPQLVYTASQPAVSILAQDTNGDGLADVTVLQQIPPPTNTDAPPVGSVDVLLSSASAQAVFTTTPQTLPAGNHTLTSTFPGDLNFNTSTSAGTAITVTQSTPIITWHAPAAIEYGTPLSATQLNATASVPGAFVYTPAAGAILAPGSSTLSVTFTPTDILDYTTATDSVTITVNPASLSGISPISANLGSGAVTLTVNGQGFQQGAVVLWNGSALATAFVSLNQLTATIPASLLTTTGKATVTVTDPNAVAVAGSETFTILAPAAVATASGPSTSDPGSQPSIQLSLNPYPAPVTVNLSLSFTPATADQPVDPTVLFANGSTVDSFVIPANSTAAIPAINLQAGSTAGTIAITVTLTADGTNITPTALAPVTIAVPPVAPVISSVTLSRSSQTLQVVITGLSSPRDMSQAQFQFEAAPGASLKTNSLTVALTSAFTTWYQNQSSTAFGTAFQYTQPFTLDSDATDVKSVTVTLTNSVGASQPATAQ